MAEDKIQSLGEISARIVEQLEHCTRIEIRAASPQEAKNPITTIPKAKPAYVGREREHLTKARLKAIEVYERAKAENISQPEAARRYGSTRHTVSEAGLILENGTIEEVALARSGKVSFSGLIKDIRNRLPRSAIKGKTPSPKPPWTGHAKRAEAKQFERFRIALEWLADGPPPQELVALAKESDTRRQLVNNKLTDAYGYLNAFVTTWQGP